MVLLMAGLNYIKEEITEIPPVVNNCHCPNIGIWDIATEKFLNCFFTPSLNNQGKIASNDFFNRIQDKISEDFPFVIKNENREIIGTKQLSTYAYGGPRSMRESSYKSICDPHDCSSAVAYSLGLSMDKTKQFTTATRKNRPSYFDLDPVCTITNSANLDKIQLNDILLLPGHISVVCGKDNHGNVDTLQYNRCLDSDKTHKYSGGGQHSYNLVEEVENKRNINIFRSSRPSYEPYSMETVIREFNEFVNENKNIPEKHLIDIKYFQN